jgi:hypothetical protein
MVISTKYNDSNDFWRFNVATQGWTWLTGSPMPSSSINIANVAVAQGVANAVNTPGNRRAQIQVINSAGT